MGQRVRQYLLRPALWIGFPLWRVDDVVEIAALAVPEAIVERSPDLFGALPVLGRLVFVLRGPAFHQLQRVEPQRVDLHRLATSPPPDPVVELRRHPRERGSL